jgi:DnaJ-class molecular chaperone
MARLLIRCPTCDGDGSYETTHPMWGSPSCPEAYVQVTCDECEGTGEVDAPEEEDEDDDA